MAANSWTGTWGVSSVNLPHALRKLGQRFAAPSVRCSTTRPRTRSAIPQHGPRPESGPAVAEGGLGSAEAAREALAQLQLGARRAGRPRSAGGGFHVTRRRVARIWCRLLRLFRTTCRMYSFAAPSCCSSSLLIERIRGGTQHVAGITVDGRVYGSLGILGNHAQSWLSQDAATGRGRRLALVCNQSRRSYPSLGICSETLATGDRSVAAPMTGGAHRRAAAERRGVRRILASQPTSVLRNGRGLRAPTGGISNGRRICGLVGRSTSRIFHRLNSAGILVSNLRRLNHNRKRENFHRTQRENPRGDPEPRRRGEAKEGRGGSAAERTEARANDAWRLGKGGRVARPAKRPAHPRRAERQNRYFLLCVICIFPKKPRHPSLDHTPRRRSRVRASRASTAWGRTTTTRASARARLRASPRAILGSTGSCVTSTDSGARLSRWVTPLEIFLAPRPSPALGGTAAHSRALAPSSPLRRVVSPAQEHRD